VPNIGGSSDINLWNPNVAQPIFSLSQQWYVNFYGPTKQLRQTVEGGWHVYPKHYGGSLNTRLFIYCTANDYQPGPGHGCYNHDCISFVQKNFNWLLGGALPQTSIDGDTQYYFTLEYFLYQGNWWLSLNGQWIGYYPGTLYRGGPLATSAAKIAYGGETAVPLPVTSTTVFPPMGSEFAKAWWTHAAFQRNIYFFSDPTHAVIADLTKSEPSPNCYTDLKRYNSGVSGWNTFTFFGGPGSTGSGGTTC
jgi:hypothetical protein